MKKTTILFAFLLPFHLITSQVFFTENFEGTLDINSLPTISGNWLEQGSSSDGIYSVGDNVDANAAGSWPVPAHSLFLQTNDDVCVCDKSQDRIILPQQDFSGFVGNINMVVDLFWDDVLSGQVTLEVSTNNGVIWNTESVVSSSASWQEDIVFDLSAYVGQPNVLISFVYDDQGFTGNGFALDNVILENYLADFTSNQNVGCLNSSIFTYTDNSIGATQWNWDFGVGANPANAVGQGPYDVTYSSSGLKTISLTIDGGVNETKVAYLEVVSDPTIDNFPSSLDQVVCVGQMTSLIDFIGTGSGALDFDWSYNTIPASTNIGLPFSGSGDISAFATLNNTGLPVVATFDVIPVDGPCSGTPIQFTITVNPLDDASFGYAQTAYCFSSADEPVSVVNTPGGTYSSSFMGFVDPLTGTIALSSFTVNTYDITYLTNGSCPNSSIIYIDILSLPFVNAVLDQNICEGQNTTDVVFSGSSFTSFDWINTNTNISLAAFGNGDILSFTTTNGTANPIIATIDVTPTDATCVGTMVSFDITVDPFFDPSFLVSSTNVCSDGINPITSVSGTTGGSFSAGPGLTIDSSTGQLDITTSMIGTYVIDYSGGIGTCATSSTFDFEIIETPFVSQIADVVICNGGLVPITPLSTLSTFPVDWTNDNLTTGIASAFGTGDIPSFTAENLVLGSSPNTSIINLSATNNGCTSNLESFNIIVHSDPIVNAGVDTIICEGLPFILNANGSSGTNYLWDNGVFQGLPFIPVAGNYVYSVTGTLNNCFSIDQINVTVNVSPTVSAGQDLIVCEFSETILAGSGAPILTWNNSVLDNVAFVPTISGNYILTGENNLGCTNKDTLVLTIESLPVPEFESDTQIACSPATITFNSANTTNSCVYSFSDGTNSVGCFNLTHEFTQPGAYDVTLTQTSINQCVGFTTISGYIVVNPLPVAGFEAENSVLDMVQASTNFVNHSTGAVSYEWNFGDNSGVNTNVEPFHTFPTDLSTEQFNVRLIAASEFGCLDTAYTTLQVEESLLLYVPNSFTPNKDEFNNNFQPVFYSGIDPLEFNMKIFNRFGQLIFETNDANYGWDGDYGSGKGLAESGIYTFKMEFSTASKDEKKLVVGTLNLIR